ncbi:germ cell-specific 1-like protein 2 isoform A [Alligator mississippiensis]|uniref:Germ cell-specific 1-like protein 2 isoform A n=1 Tax=Alligator mississippiensis TaxID=8496 RepID=A0A151MG71_ALLMI|nr:germ cell-specific 1-like protein 2 isoform A [Alligator mississippiensis]
MDLVELGPRGPLVLEKLVIDTPLGQAGGPPPGSRAASPMESDALPSALDNEEHTDFDKVLAFITSMLNDCPKGMRMRQLGKALMKQQGVNLEAFSCARGHKDVVSFLLLEVPGIRLWYPEKGEKCLVFSNAFKKIFRLRRIVWTRHGVDLEELSHKRGYLDTLDYLASISGVKLQGLDRGIKCLVQRKKAPKKKRKEKPEKQTVGLDQIWACILGVLGRFPMGLRVSKLMEAMPRQHRQNLQGLSQAWGYDDVLGLLQQLPGLRMRDSKKGHYCIVQLAVDASGKSPALLCPLVPAPTSAQHCSILLPNASPIHPAPKGPMDTAKTVKEMPCWEEVMAAILECLRLNSSGLCVTTLKKMLWKEKSVALEGFVQHMGCEGIMDLLLLQVPGIVLLFNRREQCLVQLKAGAMDKLAGHAAGNASIQPSVSLGASREDPALFSACSTCQGLTDVMFSHAKGISNVSMLLRALLGSSSCKGVLRLWRVRELVQESHGLDLDAFACSQGYEDVLSFLQDHLPGLECRWPEQGENSIIHLRPDAVEKLAENHSPEHSCSQPSTSSEVSHGSTAPFIVCASCQVSADVTLTCAKDAGISKASAPIWALRGSDPDKGGPRLQKTQKRLRESHGLDLDAVAHTQGCKGVLLSLWDHVPELKDWCPKKKCVGTGVRGDSGRLPPASSQSLPGPRRDLLKAASPAPPANGWLSPLLPSGTTTKPLPPSQPTVWKPPGVFAVHSMLSECPPVNPHLPAWIRSPSQPAGIAPCLQASKDLRPACNQRDLAELKQNVAGILAQHPQGMSLFHFKQAYSAAYQHSLPLGLVALAKQRLAEMPDVVRIQGYGVQTLLLPVADSSPTGLSLLIPEEATGPARDSDDVADFLSVPPGLASHSGVKLKAGLEEPDQCCHGDGIQ